ncbi:uncharacterized protein EDB93DRAFT_169325 [Suillus bovinus]|uniref:uncharacterized protein n=1 Tax=Suillus bovinus TaxID=48563 RepID=UPI001B873127|nr:uncharacterized protein EDB93DRAFT_169325 [Suillus bovinus]KAG2128509.1 hypothetical protein EDB93DRAFT_169325 [Suillus bovinus]
MKPSVLLRALRLILPSFYARPLTYVHGLRWAQPQCIRALNSSLLRVVANKMDVPGRQQCVTICSVRGVVEAGASPGKSKSDSFCCIGACTVRLLPIKYMNLRLGHSLSQRLAELALPPLLSQRLFRIKKYYLHD